MFNDKYYRLGAKKSAIRELFQYGISRKAVVGEENVFDFSIGNPSIEPPASINQSIVSLVESLDAVKLHGYTPAQGDKIVREKIAAYISKNSGVSFGADNIYLTCGAAAAITISLKSVCVEGDSVVVFAPHFPEYTVFVENAGANLIISSPDENMDIDLNNFEKCLNKSVKVVILNSPNNPSGLVYSREKLKGVFDILRAKEKEYGHSIYVLTDEPYREIAFDVEVPYIESMYENTLISYSFSKSMSLPGERIGYIAVSPNACYGKEIYTAICGAGRSMGFVCAPTLFQFVIAENLGETSNIEEYRKNRDILAKGLSELGFEFVRPDGAFYMFVKAPDGDAKRFSEMAKKHDLLIVSGESFGVSTHCRISYCVKRDTIIRALPKFKELLEEYLK